VTLPLATVVVAGAIVVGLFVTVAALAWGGRLIERTVYHVVNGRR